MPLIAILSDTKIQEYERPPSFSATQRKHFLSMPASIKKRVNTFSSVTNKVGFQLMFGYFLAKKQFYPTELFRDKDIKFLCNRYSCMPFAFDKQRYRETTYTRHRKIILNYFAFKSYQPSVHNQLIVDAIESQIYSWEDNERIFNFIVEWLEWRRIELPTYHNLQTIVTYSIRKRNKHIRIRLNNLLQEHHKEALDQLLEKQTKSGRKEYVLTTIQSLSTSDSPKQIRANMEKYELIQSLFQTIHLLMKQLNFSDNAIRYFGEFVTQSKVFNLARRTDRYLYLAAFCIYQRYIFEDWMTRTFLSVCQSAINKATGKEKERLFQNRRRHNQAFNQIIDIAEDSQSLVNIARKLAWEQITPIEKEQRLQELFPKQELEEKDDTLQQIKEEHQVSSKDYYYTFLEEESQSLQQRASPIIKKLTFNPLNSSKSILEAIQYFRDKQGVIAKTAPTTFLDQNDKEALVNDDKKFRVSLYKMLLFQQTKDAIKRGSLNLKYSFEYKAMDDYLIPKHIWEKDSDTLLEKANLSHLKDFHCRIDDFRKMISFHFDQTNENILKGRNKHFRKGKNGKYHIATPKVEKEESDVIIFPSEASISLSEVLATVDRATNFLDYFRHLQPVYRRTKPSKAVFFAGITAFGCNLGIPAMVRSTSTSYARQLENTANWYFSLENINRANDAITKLTDQLPLANMYRKKQDELRTSSDGQKITVVSENTIFASNSKKYYRKKRGIVSYSFSDERGIPYYNMVVDPYTREAPFVVDGLLHNEVIKSTIHTTDTHGYTEAVFGLLDLLGFGFSPNIAKMLRQHIYTFKDHSIPAYKKQGYLVLPTGYFKEQLMEESWSEILRLVVSLKLKYCKASQVFSRFNSYSKQHPLYTALKQYGRMPKTIHILRSIKVTDSLLLYFLLMEER